MLKKLLPAVAALCLLVLSAGTALGHEPRDIEDYNLVVGFLHEPAFEGILNGVYLNVTKVGEHGHGGDEASSESSHGSDSSSDHHAAMEYEVLESEVPISVSITAEVDDEGGVDVQVMTEGWTWTPDNVDGEHVPGEGHAHIYVDGVKIDRVYSPSYHLESLEPGERQVRVSLNSNSHEDLTYNGKAVEAIVMVTVPETEHNAMQMKADSAADEEGDHSHGAELITGVTGLEHTLQVEVTHAPTGATRLMRFHPITGAPGQYKADFIPTASGQYIFHMFGTIEGRQIDERFESGVGTFDDVQPANAIQFPERAASTRELEAAVRGALESAQKAEDQALSAIDAATSVREEASEANTLAIAGIVVGAVGIVIGGAGMVAALRRRN